MLIIPAINPIRFKGVLDYPLNDVATCYKQKFLTEDYTTLQVRSDEESLVCVVRDAWTGILVTQYNFSEIETLIVNGDQKIYELDIVFFDLGQGDYTFHIEDMTSFVVSVRDEWIGTKLFTYTNSKNDFGVVFDTGVVFRSRIECDIKNYAPKSDDVIYNDQLRNSTKLYSLPYNTFTLFIGNPRGVPNDIIDLMNRVMSCDMIKINDTWYEKTTDSEWEYYREDNYDMFAMSTEIMPSDNRMLEKLMIDELIDESESMIIQRYSNNYVNASEEIVILDTFEKNVVLNYVAIYRKSTPFTLKIGTTSGGSEIAEVLIEQVLHTVNLNHLFNGDATLYLSGFVGNSDVSVVWDKMDKFFDPVAVPEETTSTVLGKGAIILFDGTSEELEENFNTVNGLGRTGTSWVGWAICDGQNGTRIMGGKVPVGWKLDDVKYGTIGATGGSETHTLTTDELPNFHLNMFGNDTVTNAITSNLTANSIVAKQTSTSGSRDEKYAMRASENIPLPNQPSLGKTSNIGGEVPHNNMQPYTVLVYVKKII